MKVKLRVEEPVAENWTCPESKIVGKPLTDVAVMVAVAVVDANTGPITLGFPVSLT